MLQIFSSPICYANFLVFLNAKLKAFVKTFTYCSAVVRICACVMFSISATCCHFIHLRIHT